MINSNLLVHSISLQRAMVFNLSTSMMWTAMSNEIGDLATLHLCLIIHGSNLTL